MTVTLKLIEIVQQDAIYDGEPQLMPLGALVNLLNYHASGGTPKDLDEAKSSGEFKSPKRYRVQLHLYVGEVE